MYTITPSKIAEAQERWGRTITRYQGAAPQGLGIAHAISESNNDPQRKTRNPRTWNIGLMQIPLREAQHYKFDQKLLADPSYNIYVWGKYTNDIGGRLHTKYARNWTQPNIDFWLGVRLFFILGEVTLARLLLDSGADAATDNVTVVMRTWILETMKPDYHVERIPAKQLKTLEQHLTQVQKTIEKINGSTFVGTKFQEPVTGTPGDFITTTALMYKG